MKIIQRILSYLRPYRGQVVLAYVGLFLALALQLTNPIILAHAIDEGIVDRDQSVLLWSAVAYVVVAALQGTFTFLRVYLFSVMAERVGYDLRNQLYAHLQRLDFGFYDRSHTGQLMSRATDDINNIRAALQIGLRTVVLITATFITVSIILFRIDWVLALVALALMPGLFWGSIRYGIGIRPMFLRVQEQFGVMTSALQENVAGGRVVRAFAQETQETVRFEEELRELYHRNMETTRRWSFAYSLSLAVSGLSLAAVLWLGSFRVIDGAITVGTLVAFNRYLTMVGEPVRWLGFVVNRVARAVASGERIFGTIDTKPKIASPPDAIDPAPMRGEVRFENVSFHYPTQSALALRDVSFVARPGTTTALVGPTGSGKSSVTALIPRFYDVSEGAVLVDDSDVRTLDLAKLRAQIGLVQQDTFLFSVTIRENIAFARPDASDDEVIAAARAAQIHDFILTLPEGYQTEVGERGVTLSGGQKQRVAIARALLQNPRILVLDDATSSVDSATEEQIQRALRTLRAGRTTFVIAQRLDTVRDADQILVLNRGEITERGTHDELLARDGFYRQLYDLQRQDRAVKGDDDQDDGDVPADNGATVSLPQPAKVR